MSWVLFLFAFSDEDIEVGRGYTAGKWYNQPAGNRLTWFDSRNQGYASLG